jgi:colanic acid/amylovoran biosynthesis glycosyltransferase
MRVAYLVNQYPMVSHVFIRREILALERRGVEITRIALRGWHGELVDEEDHLERKRTRYVLRDGVPALLSALARMLVTRPVRLMKALGLALYMGRRAERPLPVHLRHKFSRGGDARASLGRPTVEFYDPRSEGI